MDIVHTLGFLHEYETSKSYTVQDFLRITRRSQAAATVVACDLCYIPSRSSSYHEFLLVHAEGLKLIIERAPNNNGTRVISSSGGIARDTITVMREREQHEYWQVSQRPICKGTLRWHQPSPRLLDIAFIASTASTTFKHYNLYIRQCYWYARITLAVMGRAFPSCAREGSTSFSRGWLSVFGSYRPSQVQLLVDLHNTTCRDLHPATTYLPPVDPTNETERHAHACRFITPDLLHGLAALVASIQRSLSQLTLPEPVVDVTNHDHTSGGMPESSQHMESH